MSCSFKRCFHLQSYFKTLKKLIGKQETKKIVKKLFKSLDIGNFFEKKHVFIPKKSCKIITNSPRGSKLGLKLSQESTLDDL